MEELEYEFYDNTTVKVKKRRPKKRRKEVKLLPRLTVAKRSKKSRKIETQI